MLRRHLWIGIGLKIVSIRRNIRAAALAAACFLGVASLLTATDQAAAQTLAYSDPGTTNLRAGPGTQYAWIGSVYGGSQIYVHFCEYGWCYVVVNGQPGWMIETRLNFAAPGPYYAPAPVYVPRYEPYFGFGLGFEFDDRRRRHDRGHHRDRDDDWGHEDGWVSEDHSGPGGETMFERRQRILRRDTER